MNFYECCNIRRFLRLLLLDAVIFAIFAASFFVGRTILTAAGGSSGSQEKGIPLPAVMYHSVREGTPAEYSVTPQQLEADLKELKRRGYTAVSAEELCLYAQGTGSLPEKPVLITFDDGFYNNLSEALPLLNKYDMCAVVSPVGAYCEVNAPLYPHDPDCSYLTWEDIRVLEASGRVEIGSHTYDMHSLTNGRRGCSKTDGESDEAYSAALTEDIAAMQMLVREQTGIQPIVFAYPFGAISPGNLPVLREQGILLTLTCREEINYITRDPDCLYGIGRFNRSGYYSAEEFADMLENGE
ncbi:MAG: polysaccharide deacetylase family protein [Ruminococcus sp.]|nr:polysaccharide deacetylase family protein [Ruminococcus sp.]